MQKSVLEDGLYIVKLLTFNKNFRWSGDKSIFELEPFGNHGCTPLFIPFLLENSVDDKKTSTFKNGDIIIKYDKKKDYVREYKTGMKIPIVYKYSRTEGFFVPFDSGKIPVICIGLRENHFQKPVAWFETPKKEPYELKDCFRTGSQKCYVESFEGSNNQNLLVLPSEDLDKIMEEYYSFYPDADSLKESMIHRISDIHNLFEEIEKNKIIDEEKLKKEKQKKEEQTKRNYEKYYYKDNDDSNKKNSKSCFLRKKKQK